MDVKNDKQFMVTWLEKQMLDVTEKYV